MKDATAQWGFVALILLIIAPLLFWIITLFLAWVKWLFKGKKELNNSYAELEDFKAPISGVYPIKIKVGTTNKLSLYLLNSEYNSIKTLIHNKKFSEGNQQYKFDTSNLGNGYYFLQLKTENQTITKKIVVNN